VSLRAIFSGLLLLVPAFTARAEISLAFASPTNASSNPLVWDSMVKEIKLKETANITLFTFWVTNTSSSNATIAAFESTCDCTVPESPALPWVLKPGASDSMKVRMRTLGRFGQITKQIGVHTSHGPQILTVTADIPLTPAPFNVSGRLRDQMAAQEDRQVVFRGSCAACHALPAVGRTGKPLFDAACAICHISTHRAAMVPDLAALPHPTDAAHWRTWITHGKEGSLMPAFDKAHGGILDTNQIESLVEYLLQAYPSKPASSAGGVTNALPVPAAQK
jgi:mono/diheme cytochrome c family protein